MPQYKIRIATESDLEVLLSVVRSHFDFVPYRALGGLLDEGHVLDLILDVIESNILDGVVFVADLDGEIIGVIFCASLPPNPALKGQTLAGEPLWWVREDYRGTRLGIRLLKYFEEWGLKTGHDYLQVGAIDGRTGKLLERLGYTEVGRTYMKKIQH